ncbi:MAG: chloramphenicol acetyltransferase [Chloroflexi bacterium HGW-Chloroflexi-10]|nr:MAG: chloramphenicol acetyltransferase [Chloroflexi bacterium HGW-Chloroflexi-10]
MKIIDRATWKRREHFEFYSRLDFPYLNITANMDITHLYTWVKHNGYSLFAAVTYIVTRAGNAIPELRQRIRGEQIVEHEVIRPAFTVLAADETFGFATIDYNPDFPLFHASVQAAIEATRRDPNIHDEPGRDDMFFLTTVPWVSFTQISHPLPLKPPDSFPRISWGKFFELGDKRLMPLSLLANHALVDGLHVGRFFEGVQAMLDAPITFGG